RSARDRSRRRRQVEREEARRHQHRPRRETRRSRDRPPDPLAALTRFQKYAAALALTAAGALVPLTLAGVSVDGRSATLVVLAAAAAFGFADNVLTAIAAALLGSTGVVAYLRENLALSGWTEASLLALVPVVVAAASTSVWLIPLLFVPVAGIFVGARQGMA